MSDNDTFPEVLSTVYHALSASRRCYAILILAETDDELSVQELSRRITATEKGVPLSRATGEPYRNVYNALSQTHLSTLEDAGIMNYDSDRQIVTTGPNFTTAVLLIKLNQTAYQTLQNEDIPDIEDILDPSTTD